MLNKELSADDVIREIINEYRLGNQNRIGLLIEARLNIGDIYFFVSELTYAQKITGKRFVIVTPKESTAYIFSRWHKENGADIELIILTLDEYNRVRAYLQKNNKKFAGALELYNYWYNTELLSQSTTNKDIYQNLTRPIFPFFDRKKYVETYKIIPGKTVFIIPESNCQESLPDFFWSMSIGFFKMLGYQVLVNAKENANGYEGAVSCFPPFDDIVALCDLCGTVYSIRTGLVELIAAETNAKVYIFGVYDPRPKSSLRSIMSVYPYIDNSDHHIVEIAIPHNNVEFSWIKRAMDCRAEALNIMRENLYLRDKMVKCVVEDDGFVSPSSVIFKPRSLKKRIFDFSNPRWVISPFFLARYKLFQKNNILIFILDVKPIINYKIHVALKFKDDNKYVKSYINYDYSTAYFDPEDDGDYCVSVHIVHPKTGESGLFNTDNIKLLRPTNYRLQRSETYAKYINILREIKENVVIFITSKDAHTDWNRTRKLGLDIFSIQTNLQRSFRHSWLCVIDGGRLMKELTSEDQEVSTEYEWDGNLAYITSAGYNVNRNDQTPVSIKINDKEYCVNRRGLNFVVWDKKKNCLLDSVCFDTYWHEEAFRKDSI